VTPPLSLFSSEAARLLEDGYDLDTEQRVRYTYWPVSFFLGDPTVISNAPLPLSGVKFSEQLKGVGELRASLQLADPDVREMNPWELILPRKTGIVVVRSVLDEEENTEAHQAVWFGVVWARTPVPATGRWEIIARTIEYNWSRRLITGPMNGGDLVWAQEDRTTIVGDLLTPSLFSQLGPADNLGTATAVTGGTTTTFVAGNTDALDVAVGSYVTILDSTGQRRQSALGDVAFRVTGKVAAANTTITFTPALTVATAVGDLMTAGPLFPGWITVDKPTAMTGRLHDMSYKRDQQTNLLTAHVDRSNVDDGYDWRTTVRVLDGDSAIDAASYRVQYVMGYPRLGRSWDEADDEVPRFVFRASGEGNVISVTQVYDGSAVSNAVWGQGAGYDDTALRQLATNQADWANGFLITESRYSNPDVKLSDTLLDYTIAALVQSYANEQFITGLTVRGDKPPYFDTYTLGDDALFTTDDWTNPDGPSGDRDYTSLTRIMGWVVTPPEGTAAETVQLVVGVGTAVDGG